MLCEIRCPAGAAGPRQGHICAPARGALMGTHEGVPNPGHRTRSIGLPRSECQPNQSSARAREASPNPARRRSIPADSAVAGARVRKWGRVPADSAVAGARQGRSCFRPIRRFLHARIAALKAHPLPPSSPTSAVAEICQVDHEHSPRPSPCRARPTRCSGRSVDERVAAVCLCWDSRRLAARLRVHPEDWRRCAGVSGAVPP